MQYYGYKLNAVEGPMENIKITTPADFYIFGYLYIELCFSKSLIDKHVFLIFNLNKIRQIIKMPKIN